MSLPPDMFKLSSVTLDICTLFGTLAQKPVGDGRLRSLPHARRMWDVDTKKVGCWRLPSKAGRRWEVEVC